VFHPRAPQFERIYYGTDTRIDTILHWPALFGALALNKPPLATTI